MSDTETQPTPADLAENAERVRRAEAQGEGKITLEFEGGTYEVPRDFAQWPAAATLALQERQEDIVFLKALLTPEDFADFLSRRPTNRDAVDLAVQFIRGLGFKDAGESAASSD